MMGLSAKHNFRGTTKYFQLFVRIHYEQLEPISAHRSNLERGPDALHGMMQGVPGGVEGEFPGQFFGILLKGLQRWAGSPSSMR